MRNRHRAALLTIGLLATLSVTASARGHDHQFRISVKCRYCVAGSDIFISSNVWSPTRTPLTIESSVLGITRGEQAPAKVFEDSFCRDVGKELKWGNRSTSCFSTEIRDWLVGLEPGEYTAVWLVNGRKSNTVVFEIVDTLAGSSHRPLLIEPLTGVEDDDLAFVMYLGPFDDDIDLMRAWIGARLWIDGHELRRRGFRWAGSSGLGAGERWSTTVNLAAFEPDALLGPGVHEVRWVMNDEVSNSLRLEIGPEAGSGRFSRWDD